jgi:hypothetical protein
MTVHPSPSTLIVVSFWLSFLVPVQKFLSFDLFWFTYCRAITGPVDQ